MGDVPSVVWAEIVMACDASTRAISSIAIMKQMVSSPAPPSSSGHGIPSRPSSPIFFTFSQGNSCDSSKRAATGAPPSPPPAWPLSRPGGGGGGGGEKAVKRGARPRREVGERDGLRRLGPPRGGSALSGDACLASGASARGRDGVVAEPEAVVALLAVTRRRGIAEVAENEAAAAPVAVGVLLHDVELRELRVTPALHGSPVNRPSRDRRRRIGHDHAFADARPDQVLPPLQLVEVRGRGARA